MRTNIGDPSSPWEQEVWEFPGTLGSDSIVPRDLLVSQSAGPVRLLPATSQKQALLAHTRGPGQGPSPVLLPKPSQKSLRRVLRAQRPGSFHIQVCRLPGARILAIYTKPPPAPGGFALPIRARGGRACRNLSRLFVISTAGLVLPIAFWIQEP